MTLRTLLPLLLAALLLLPSCRWNIGERIRSDSAVHAGVHVSRPMDGQVWHTPSDPRCYYAYVPEVSYRVKPDIVESFIMLWPPSRQAHDVRLTGRSVLVRCAPDPLGGFTINVADALPEGAKAYPLHDRAALPRELSNTLAHRRPHKQYRDTDLGDLDSETATRGSIGAQILAAPFDFVIDPALSVITTPLYACGFVGCLIFCPSATR